MANNTKGRYGTAILFEKDPAIWHYDTSVKTEVGTYNYYWRFRKSNGGYIVRLYSPLKAMKKSYSVYNVTVDTLRHAIDFADEISSAKAHESSESLIRTLKH